MSFGAINGTWGNDTLTGTDANDRINGRAGNDEIRGGAGIDWVNLGSGNDLGIFNMSANNEPRSTSDLYGGDDRYMGGWGQDTLRIEFTKDEWFQEDVQEDVADYLDYLATSSSPHYVFSAFDLYVNNFEVFEVTVDGVQLNPEDEAVTLMDDTAAVDENSSVIIDVLANDDVPDLVKELTLVSGVTNGVLTQTADDTFDFVANEDFDYLAVGETVTETFEYQVTDADDDTETAIATITISGVNDEVVLGDADVAGAVTEDDVEDDETSLRTHGAIAFTDLDVSDEHTVTAVLKSTTHDTELGGLTASILAAATGGNEGSAGWVYDVANADVQFLGEGQEVTQVYTVTVDDGNGSTAEQDVEVTITGVNDEATIAGNPAAEVTEDVNLSVQRLLTVNDVDQGEAGFQEFQEGGTLEGDYGTLSYLEDQEKWRYELDNNSEAVQELNEGDKVYDTFTVTSLDGTAEQEIKITVKGTNDEAVISGDTGGVVTEDSVLDASGSLDVTDVDDGEDSFVAGSFTGTYGSLEINEDGEWTYTLDNDSDAVQELTGSTTETDSFTVQSIDGTEQAIDITVAGAWEELSINFNDYDVGFFESHPYVHSGYQGFNWDSARVTYREDIRMTAAGIDGGDASLTMTRSDGDTFQFVSVDYENVFPYSWSHDVTYTGFLEGNEVGSVEVSLNNVGSEGTVTPSWGEIDTLVINLDNTSLFPATPNLTVFDNFEFLV